MMSYSVNSMLGTQQTRNKYTTSGNFDQFFTDFVQYWFSIFTVYVLETKFITLGTLRNFYVIRNEGKPFRDGKYLRTRWREGYCRDLAEKEDSFLAEHQLDPLSHDLLSEMLKPDLGVNEDMANLSSKYGKSFSIRLCSDYLIIKLESVKDCDTP